MHHYICWKASSPISPPGPQLPSQSATHPRQAAAISPFWMKPRKPLVGCTSGRKWLMYGLELRGIRFLGKNAQGLNKWVFVSGQSVSGWWNTDNTLRRLCVIEKDSDGKRSLEAQKLRQWDTENAIPRLIWVNWSILKQFVLVFLLWTWYRM